MKILVDMNEADIVVAAQALRTSREYVKAILEAAESSPKGCEAGETIKFLARANALDRARLALLAYTAVEVVEPSV
jgi:hypothetical protein